MKILVPVKNLLSWVELIKSWADEIYFWVISEKWQETHGYKTMLNRRDGKMANFINKEDPLKLIDFARKQKVETYITLNSNPIWVNLKEIEEEIVYILNLKPDWIIVKDLIIATLIRKYDKNIILHSSWTNQVLNEEAIKFWRDKFNIKRIIFPRHITAKEIKYLCDLFPDVEFEIFIKNDWCYDSDWSCTSLHIEWLKEWIAYVCHREHLYKSYDEKYNNSYNILRKSMWSCKACLLWQLVGIKNLVSIKIVWRDKSFPSLIKDIDFLKKSIKFLEISDNIEEYMNFNINYYSKLFNKNCNYKKCELFTK